MCPQECHHVVGQRNAPEPGAGLRLAQDPLARDVADEVAADCQVGVFQIEVTPGQGQRLTVPHARAASPVQPVSDGLLGICMAVRDSSGISPSFGVRCSSSLTLTR